MTDKNSNIVMNQVADFPPDKLKSKEWKEIRRDRLINSLNHINFQDAEVILNFRHTQYNTILSLPAKPQPCSTKVFFCNWSDPEFSEQDLHSYEFEDFYFSDGLKKVLVNAEIADMTSEKIKLLLPQKCVEISSRKIRRHRCESISAQLSQEGLIIEGTLENFSAVSFLVNIAKASKNDLQHIDQDSTVHVFLKRDAVFCYSGICKIVRLSSSSRNSEIVLKPLKNQIKRFKSKQYRSVRQKLLPMPSIVFNHPLTGKNIRYKALDISGSGFSVEEEPENSILMPGMVIPELYVEPMNNVQLNCKAQVVYRNADEDGKIQCGFAFLNMSLRDQVNLSSLLHQAKNEKSYVCTKVDVNELWDFFFDTDFIYPEKYSFIYENKSEFKEVYKKLYENNPEFAVNFICKDRGLLFAHMSMFRYYEKTWIINHHAANSSRNTRGGLIVLEQISRYINEFHQFNSDVMDYVACYYRPQNRFPNLVFGGVAKHTKDLTSCSVDQFAYLSINKKYLDSSLTGKWSLSKTTKKEIKILQHFYEQESGGLSLQALDLLPNKINREDELNRIYRENGFQRDKYLFSLMYKDQLIAIVMVNISDIGLNLSDLTNCIHIFIIEPHKLPSDILHSALSEIATFYEHNNIPVLIYPSSYTDNNSISISKIYNFWVLDVHKIGDRYFTYLDKMLRLSK
ncbi:MAG: PilZ domain-containing protein [Desulfobulbales bacterium]|nr:PilZ domain-containing protein [Desulfobulbales bacterium]